jgi:photosystem II stability/assembly factor-like uncharacterized protein
LPALVTVLGLVAAGDAWAQAAGRIEGLVRRDPLHDVALRGDGAWVVGFPGLALVSKDRGTTFAQQGPGGAAVLLAVDRVDDRVGYACGRQGTVWKTNDAGMSWTAMDTGTTEPLLALDFLDAQRGIVVGNFGTVLRTDDGGTTWTAVQAVEEGEDPKFNGVVWIDPRTVVIVGEMGVVVRSTDGGATWVRQDEVVEGHLFGVAATGDGAGVLAVGSDGAIAHSTDGGETWTRVDSGTGEHLFRAAVADGHTLVAGAAGTMLVANAPGGPFEAVKVPTYLWLGSVALAPDGFGLAVGARAAILVTRDFGRSWKRWGAK